MNTSIHASGARVLEFDLTQEDYVAFWSDHYARSQVTKRTIRYLRYGFPVIWLLVVPLGGIDAGDLIWLVLALVWIAAVPKFMGRSTRKQISRLAAQGICRGSFGTHRFTVGDDGVVDATEFYDSKTYWAGIERVVRTPELIGIYVGPNAAHVVPNRAFGSEQELSEFVQRVQGAIAAD